MRMLVSADRLGARLLAALALLPLAGCSSGPAEFHACQKPTTSDGIVSCADGWDHRVSAPTCAYGCAGDAACGAGMICVCNEGGVGECKSSTCQTDADCGEGFLCASDPEPYCDELGGGYEGYSCQKPGDECMTDRDCPSGYCSIDSDHRYCESGDPCEGIGRPFLVEGDARTAPLVARADWQARGLAPDMSDLDAEARTTLATRWALMGAMEHASVAAFARFVLQLLSLGAPSDLIRDAQAAMADETRHAELCYALASAYAATPLGPGPLDVDRALGANDPREILVTTIREGCVGETVAALEAAETAARAADHVVRAVLRQIAEDEARHAELAYRFVRWALDAHPHLADEARAVFDDALAARARVGDGGDDVALAAHGIVGDGLRREIRGRALAGAVAPCARALLARAA